MRLLTVLSLLLFADPTASLLEENVPTYRVKRGATLMLRGRPYYTDKDTLMSGLAPNTTKAMLNQFVWTRKLIGGDDVSQMIKVSERSHILWTTKLTDAELVGGSTVSIAMPSVQPKYDSGRYALYTGVSKTVPVVSYDVAVVDPVERVQMEVRFIQTRRNRHTCRIAVSCGPALGGDIFDCYKIGGCKLVVDVATDHNKGYAANSYTRTFYRNGRLYCIRHNGADADADSVAVKPICRQRTVAVVLNSNSSPNGNGIVVLALPESSRNHQWWKSLSHGNRAFWGSSSNDEDVIIPAKAPPAVIAKAPPAVIAKAPPAVIAKAPVTTIKIPVTTKVPAKVPMTTNKVPVTTIKVPVTTVKVPVTTTQASIVFTLSTVATPTETSTLEKNSPLKETPFKEVPVKIKRGFKKAKKAAAAATAAAAAATATINE